MDEWNRLTPVRMLLSLTQAARGKPIPTGLAPVRDTKARSMEAPSQYSAFHLRFVHSEARMPSLARLSKRFRAAVQKTLLPPDSLDMDAAYQDFCNTIKKAAKRLSRAGVEIIIFRVGMQSVNPSIKPSCILLREMTHAPLLQLCLPSLTESGGIDSPRQFGALTYHTPVKKRGVF